ncbi:MAG: OsmC family protein [Acidibrevibacterium sp.]|uniref:OsmC family protein n=1 Tax=Acidibrevibacterium TaxID=2603324 RepID=UPI000E0D2A83|nr:OsmC family protein [Acidibrevibacterium fodinaquatile]MCA7119013.1 OsmC family protein [Acidibrevibacterium fodinaquatile]
MDQAGLRARQAPLKERYRLDPEAARSASRAEARLVPGEVACRVVTHGGEIQAGLHPATGGDGSEACSGDMLLEALVACAGVTLSAVAIASGVTFRAARVIAEGSWDARGTLGIDRAAPVGIKDIALRFEVDTDADDRTLARLIETTERYCVVFQTLRQPPALSCTYHRSGEGA